MASHRRCSSIQELPRSSALTAVLDAQRTKSVIHRLFYIAKISPERTDYSDITDHYEQLFHKLVKFSLGESVSGLLMIYPSCVIHIIETTSEILYKIIQDLIDIQKGSVESLLQEPRILVISHNIPSRLFQRWYFRIIKLPVRYLYDMQGELEEEVTEECLKTLLKLGTFLSETLEPGSKGSGEDLNNLPTEMFVQEETIHFLIQSGRFMKPEEFLIMYGRPINVNSSSDHLWPATQFFDLL